MAVEQDVGESKKLECDECERAVIDKTNSALLVLKARSCRIWRAMYWTRGLIRLQTERTSGFWYRGIPALIEYVYEYGKSLNFNWDDSLLNDYYFDLDIENMSYEEVVEYFEQIGNVGTSLSEEIFTRVVKTKTFLAPNNLEGVTSNEQETDICVICQDEYKNQEEIGILRCRHEYHVDCIRRWLHEKNVCPICKSEVLDHE
ncbi:probable E3 ubiquitin-protein ligase ZFP1 [Vigna unguiculata]|uniref:probable E3 ubiquitin-protein ligase ZFP1 n=1 Tax=Vigna unguiculata TaxID=3917 RepID=UPI001016B82E|nr:probable E3 ubiquitin-protein ligase ZFP1 [Vigna unguiculata]